MLQVNQQHANLLRVAKGNVLTRTLIIAFFIQLTIIVTQFYIMDSLVLPIFVVMLGCFGLAALYVEQRFTALIAVLEATRPVSDDVLLPVEPIAAQKSL
ncbi:hypothetical protein [Thalassotalea maritima]|uniref:hypothetical protein n=1 Tax=Thalassotalea maritima TaxID=3242416 RepID=UPI0035275CC3